MSGRCSQQCDKEWRDHMIQEYHTLKITFTNKPAKQVESIPQAPTPVAPKPTPSIKKSKQPTTASEISKVYGATYGRVYNMLKTKTSKEVCSILEKESSK